MFCWELKSPFVLCTSLQNALFQTIICVWGVVFPWKKRCDSESPIGPEAPFPFCNLLPFFTFVSSIGSTFVWFVASFWVICSAFPTHNFSVSAATFPTEPVSEQMSCHFYSLVTTSSAFLGCYGSLPALFPFLQWQHRLRITLTLSFLGSLSLID